MYKWMVLVFEGLDDGRSKFVLSFTLYNDISLQSLGLKDKQRTS